MKRNNNKKKILIMATKTMKTTKTYLGGRIVVEKEKKNDRGKIYTIKGPWVEKIVKKIVKNK